MTVLWAAFWLILLVPLALAALYMVFARGQDYDVGTVVRDARAVLGQTDAERYTMLLRTALCKVNGWNTICTLYACLYYCLNLWSLAFAVFNIIVVSIEQSAPLVTICSVIVSMLLCCTLFLRLDKKWMAFKKLLARARVLTNNFLRCLDKCADPAGLIKLYANRIIRLESSLDENDLL